MRCARTQQIIRILTGIEDNELAIRNASSCNGIRRLRRKAFATSNLITVVKKQRHQSQRLDALDSNDLEFHLEIDANLICQMSLFKFDERAEPVFIVQSQCSCSSSSHLASSLSRIRQRPPHLKPGNSLRRAIRSTVRWDICSISAASRRVRKPR